MPHVVLLGDSVFDNAAYVASGPDVVAQLRERLPPGWTATLRAVDGATIADIESQLRSLPRDATHLVLSAGGNDLLSHLDFLEERARSVAEVLDQLGDRVADFEQRYRRMLERVLAARLPLVVCTIYDGWLPDPGLRRRARTALAVFDDAILRSASAAGLPVIELRQVCGEPEDYANPIEPSVQGGRKIAAAIVAVLGPFGG